MATRILVVEDEGSLNEMISDYLRSVGYEIASTFTGPEAIERFNEISPSLVVLDLMLPGLDGIEVARSIRRKSDTPIVMLTAKSSEGDMLLGLEIGADDYITKPVSLQILAARIRSVLRRTNAERAPEKSPIIEYGPFRVDRRKRTVMRNDEQITLTPTQFELFAVLISEPGRAFRRSDLIQITGGYEYEGYERTIDTHVKNIRKAVEDDPGRPKYLTTAWRVGYRFEELDESR